jgi:CRISPR system Cascade subunit CasB
MERANRFARWLRRLDRAGRAELRRSLAFEPGTYPKAFPYVEPYVAHDSDRHSLYLLAGLYALYEQGNAPGSTPEAVEQETGASLGSAVAELYARRDKSTSIEARFIALLDADLDQLAYRLRHMIALLKAEQIALDWPQLLRDLLSWSHERRFVQQRWAREFYRAPQNEEVAAQNEEAIT